jgi:hypothetical protein
MNEDIGGKSRRNESTRTMWMWGLILLKLVLEIQIGFYGLD